MKGIHLWLQNLAAKGEVPGLAMQVMYKGEIKIQSGVGYANLEHAQAVTPHTLFRIASISKPITGTALGMLLQDGKIDLEDSVSTFVPEFEDSSISIRHLAGHTSGIRGYKGKEPILNRSWTAAESISLFKDDPLLFPPGTDFFYNTFNYVLLALAMERAAEEPFSDLMYKRVLKPLGMEHTLAEVPGCQELNQAQWYRKGPSGFELAPPVDNRYKLGGGGYLSTVSDICKLGQYYLDNDWSANPVLQSFFQPQSTGYGNVNYGLGWQLSPKLAKRQYFGHGGNGIGAFGNFYVFPDQQLVVSLLCNCTRPNIQGTINKILEEICTEADRGWR